MTPYERLLLPENLYYAWNKAKNLYRMSDGYVDQAELAEFELDLENRLKLIHEQFEGGSYKLQKVRPLPRPKKIDDDGKYINRQYYHIAVDDQVAWIAIVNALGPDLDKEMPAWSYGNRLYRPAWYEDDDKKKSNLNIGPYRHSGGNLYKHFKHSWPLFRRHVYITARKMVNSFKKEEETEKDVKAFEAGEKAGLQYFKDWWPELNDNNSTLYCASIDLEKFFPSIKKEQVIKNLLSEYEESDSKLKMESILERMFNFKLDMSGVAESKILDNVEPKFDDEVKGLPTGLWVSGFLSNVAMLEIDKAINKKIATNRKVAHFRFVDDHTIISYNFDELCKWVEEYKTLVETQIGVNINEEKYDPKSLFDYLKNKDGEGLKKQAEKDTEIDGNKPTKLQTKTLEQVSEIAVTDENVLSDKDLDERLMQLEWLLLADIPDREMRADTRAAFAAGKITRIASIKNSSNTDIVDIFRKLIPIIDFLKLEESPSKKEQEELAKKTDKLDSLINEFLEKNKNDTSIKNITAYTLFNPNNDLDYFIGLSQRLEEHHESSRSKHIKRYFKLLLDAMKNHQSKPRLFFRLHQYCLSTGHKMLGNQYCTSTKGYNKLGDLAAWIQELRGKDEIWGDYYANLTLQLLAKNIILAVRRLESSDSLRSEQNAAKSYIEDIARINTKIFTVKNEAWFHTVARQNFAISVMVSAEFIENKLNLPELVKNLKTIHQHYKSPTFQDESSNWLKKSGYVAGVWAQLIEPKLSINDIPSCLWGKFELCLDYQRISDRRAIRRYPEAISDKAWSYIVTDEEIKENDSGWISDILIKDSNKIDDAKESDKPALKFAAKAVKFNQDDDYTSLTEWTKYVKEISNPFDPRISEWTALEIIRQLIEPEIDRLKYRVNPDSIHPHNILIPLVWQTKDKLTWESWKSITQSSEQKVKTNANNLIIDYRYSYNQFDAQINTAQQKFEQKLRAIGMALLGLLKLDYSLPKSWNIRGNERLSNLPRSRAYQSLAVSSKTMLLIEACLELRSVESRYSGLLIYDEKTADDTRDDLIKINIINDLIDAIKESQASLEENQISVSNHQLRQLIPFDLEAIAAFAKDKEEGADA